MAEATISQEALKQAVKEALTETLFEQRELFREVMVDILEDWALVAAIEKGQATKLVERERIFSLFDDLE